MKNFPITWLIAAVLACVLAAPMAALADRPLDDDGADDTSADHASADDATAADSAVHPEKPKKGKKDSDGSSSEPERLEVYDEVEVRERADALIGIAASSSEGSVGRLDLERRPIIRAGELIETAPGVVATQHSGGGKANQFFVRGFNLDHGTDFSIKVAGVPVNLPTHGHGQGYADLNFVIPEMIERVRYRKGPYFADVGDFSAAGSADMQLRSSLDRGMLSLSGSSDENTRLLWADGLKLGSGFGAGGPGDGEIIAAIEVFEENGPWTRAQDYNGYKGLVRWSAGDAERGHGLTLMAYDADWLSTDQVPRRAVESGQIGRFDLIDPGPRGSSQRISLSGHIHRGDRDAYTELTGYVLHSDFDLISNFTYFLEDPENGDQFEQLDERTVAGLELRRSWVTTWAGRRVELGAGASLRFDDIENGLFRSRELVRFDTVRSDRIEQLQAGLWSDASIRLAPKTRLRVGLRADSYDADVESQLAANTGSESDFLLSPKLSLVLGPWSSTEVYINAGYGYHSNDARGTVITVDPTSGEPVSPVQPLVRARGADIGFRTQLASGLHTTFTLFVLELDSELVFVGDGGATEPNGESRRFGLEWANFYRVNDFLKLDLDVTLTDAEFTEVPSDESEIPGAIGTTIAAGLSFEDLFESKSGALHGALRWRYFGDVPLIEDGSVEWSSSSQVNARLGYRFSNGLDLSLDIFNLLDSEDSDIEYFYASRLPGEGPDGVEDVHFHPVPERAARLTIGWRY